MSAGTPPESLRRSVPRTLPEVIKALEGVLKTDVSERPKVVLWALRGFGESAAPAGPAVCRGQRLIATTSYGVLGGQR